MLLGIGGPKPKNIVLVFINEIFSTKVNWLEDLLLIKRRKGGGNVLHRSQLCGYVLNVSLGNVLFTEWTDTIV